MWSHFILQIGRERENEQERERVRHPQAAKILSHFHFNCWLHLTSSGQVPGIAPATPGVMATVALLLLPHATQRLLQFQQFATRFIICLTVDEKLFLFESFRPDQTLLTHPERGVVLIRTATLTSKRDKPPTAVGCMTHTVTADIVRARGWASMFIQSTHSFSLSTLQSLHPCQLKLRQNAWLWCLLSAKSGKLFHCVLHQQENLFETK